MATGRYRLLLLDFDGVLSDSLVACMEEINRISCTTYPQIPEVKNQEDMTSVYSVELRHSLYRFGLNDLQTKHFFDLHSRAMSLRALEVEPFYQVIRVLSACQIPKVVITSSYSEVVHKVLGKCKEYHPEFLMAVLGREVRKTKTEKINHVLSLLGINREDALYVGDLTSDILYCRDVPVDIACVGYGYHPPPYLQQFGPDYLFETQEDFIRFLQDQEGITLWKHKINRQQHC